MDGGKWAEPDRATQFISESKYFFGDDTGKMSCVAWISLFIGYLIISEKNVHCNMEGEDGEKAKTEDGDIREYSNIVFLISDVQQNYKARSVFLIYDNDASIGTTTLMLELTREFSRKLVSSLTLNFTEVMHYRDVYRSRIIKPLFVTILTSKKEVDMLMRLSKVHEMSYAIWLVIFTEPVSDMCEEPRYNIFNVAFDTEMIVQCFKDPMIKEWYSLSEDKIIVKDLASWDPKEKLKLRKPKSLYERRHDLDGKTLRIATFEGSPFVTTQDGFMTGFFAKILQELKNTLNFTIKLVVKEDPYGSYNEKTGEWSGILGQLARGEVDLGVAEFTMTGQRLDAFDFTHPIMSSRNCLYMRQPDSLEFQWSSYIRVYSWNVWIALQAMWSFSSMVITFMRIFSKEDKPLLPGHISKNALDVWRILWLQSVPDFPSASSMRIVYLSLLVTAVILTSAYSACLISYLTISIPSLPFKSFAEFAEDGSYKLMTVQQSSDHDIFASSENEILKKMFSMMDEPHHQPETVMDGFNKACNHRVAFYKDEESKSQISSAIPCNVLHIDSGTIDSFSMILMKNSQYKGIINYHLQKFKDVGIMNHLRSRVSTEPPENKFRPMNLVGVVSILMILGIGMGLSMIILFFEKIIFNSEEAKRRHINLAL